MQNDQAIQSDLLKALKQHKLVAIVRGVANEQADRAAQALADGGVRLLEATMNTPGALGMVSRWREQHAGRLRVGAGTVLNVAMAKDAIAAGAEFLISPNVDEAVIEYAVGQGVPIWPGAMTPTEIVRAHAAGAGAIKLFPAGPLGVNYLKDVRGPLAHVPLIATGGIGLDNAIEFLRAGAVAVGVGSNLVDPRLIAAGRFDELAALAARYVAAVGTADGAADGADGSSSDSSDEKPPGGGAPA